MIVVEPVLLAVAVTEQLPPKRVQVEDEKVTMPEGDWDQVTVPVGEFPVTDATQVEIPPTWTVEGVQVTEVDDPPDTTMVA